MTRRSDGLISPIVALSRRVIQDVKRETLIVGQAISSAMQPWKGGIGNAAIAGAAVQQCSSGISAAAAAQLSQLSGSSSSAITAQLHQQHSRLQQYRLRQPCSPNQQPCSRAALQPCSRAALHAALHAAVQPCSHAAVQPCSLAALQPCSHAALQP